MKMVNPSDAELNAAFAEKVAGWTNDGSHWGWHRDGAVKRTQDLDDFTTSADAVLPWLEKCDWTACGNEVGSTVFVVPVGEKTAREGNEKSFAKAAVIALLAAHGVEIEFTQ